MECLNLKKRTINSSHSAKKLRRQGIVPGVLYGGNRQNFLFEIGEMDLNKEILNNGEFGLVNINIDGHEEKALIKEVQKNPVTHEIIHIDLESVTKDKIVNAEVPIKYCNESLVKKNGAIIQKERDTVTVKCCSENIPKYIEIGHNCIASEYKGKGYGKRQLQEAVKRISSKNVRKIVVTTDERLFPAQKNYERAGFQFIQYRKNKRNSVYAGKLMDYEILL